MDNNAIVVSGVGIISPMGFGKESTLETLEKNRITFGKITLQDNDNIIPGYPLPSFKPQDFLSASFIRRMPSTIIQAIICAKLALNDAKLEITDKNQRDIGVVIGTGLGSLYETENFLKKQFLENEASPISFMNSVHNIFASSISFNLSLQGANSTLTGREISFEMALVQASNFLSHGLAKYVLVGGIDELTCFSVKTYKHFNLLASSANIFGTRPFGGEEFTTYPGEGGAVFLLESLSSAKERGVTPYALISPVVTNHPGKECNLKGGINLFHELLKRTERTLESIDFILMPANGKKEWDQPLLEIGKSFGKQFASYKSYFGESAIVGSIQMAIGLLSMVNKKLYTPIVQGDQNNLYVQSGGVEINKSHDLKNIYQYGKSRRGTQAGFILSSI